MAAPLALLHAATAAASATQRQLAPALQPPRTQTLATKPEFLPGVDCIRYIVVNEGNASHPTNDALAPFQAQMERLGLWPRITVQWMVKDPRGKTAGCFAGHRQAWAAALAEGCHNMMAMEEDLVYAEDEIEPSATHANAFITSGEPYDMLMLGWGSSISHPRYQGAPLRPLPLRPN